MARGPDVAVIAALVITLSGVLAGLVGSGALDTEMVVDEDRRLGLAPALVRFGITFEVGSRVASVVEALEVATWEAQNLLGARGGEQEEDA